MIRYRNAALFVALAVAWGAAFTAIKAGLAYFPPVLFAAYRYDLAAVMILAYAAYATDRWRPRTRDEWLAVASGGALMIAAYHALLFVGEQGTTSAAAAIIVGLSPILTTAFARAFLPDEALTVLGMVGLLLGFGGVAVLSDPDPNDLLGAGTVSELLVLLAAASFALGSVLTRRVDPGLPVETLQGWAMLVGALLMHVVSVGIGESPSAVRWTPEAVAALGYLVVIASALGFLVYFDLLERLGPVEINLVSYAAPVAAAATGIVFLGEDPTVRTVAGFGLVLAGFVLIKRRALREELGVWRAGRAGERPDEGGR
ncbi:EamA family transporter [Halobacteriales archaeon QS_8_69_26]|nr:MAG: EamA family transporter [Halobacteriales archaeon QS_8_69_26]